jgi:ankyrin repeat protein
MSNNNNIISIDREIIIRTNLDGYSYYTYDGTNEEFLLESIKYNNYDMFKKCIDIGINGTDSNYKCYILNIISSICRKSNRLEFIKYLLEQESHINSNYSISDILEDACLYKNLDIVRFLVQSKFDLIEMFDKILLTHTFSESNIKILRDIINENYSVKPCCKK